MVESRPRTGERHFSEEDWLDRARFQGVADEAMEGHLAGCAACASTASFWRSVVAAAGRDAASLVPDEAVRQARGVFALARLQPRGLAARARQAATLVFDSLRQPQPAGVRAAAPSARHLLYKAGSYVIRLRVEPAGASDRVSIVGQVLDEADPARALADLAVLALCGPETIDRTLTNPLGEFQLEPEAADNLRLSVGVPDRGPLTVGLLLRTRASHAGARARGGTERAKAKTRRPGPTARPRR